MNAVKVSVRDDAGRQVATLFVRGSLLPRYEPRQALALLAALCVSAGTSAGLTLGVKVALLRAHAPPAALERLAQSIDDTAAADDDPSGHETILSADAALAIALPLLFGSYSEVPFDLKTRHDPFIWLGLPHVLSTGTQPSSVIAPSVIVPSLRYLESRRPARALVECCSCAPSWSSPRAACTTSDTASTSTRASCATRRRSRGRRRRSPRPLPVRVNGIEV